MANVKNESMKTRNVVEIIGKVKENKLQCDKDKVNGSLVIQYGNRPQDQVEVKIYIGRTKKDGEENKTYDTAKEWVKLVSEAQATEEYPVDVVRIYNGKADFAPCIRLNEYKNENTGEVVSVPEISLGFGKVYKGDFTEDRFKGEFDVVVYLHKNPKKEVIKGEETGRLIAEALMLEHDGAVKPLTFIVEDEELIEGISECEKGQTVNFWGSCQIAQIEETKVKKSGFGGKAKTESNSYSQRQLIVEGGDPIEEDDKQAIDSEFIKKALLERETFLENLSKEEKDSKPKTKGGFGGDGVKKKNGDIPF